LRDLDEALAWFDLEIQNLTAMQVLAVELDRPDVVWRLAWAMSAHNGRFGLLRAEITSWRAGLAAARAVGDPNRLSLSHRFLTYAATRVGDHREALRHARQSLALAERTGNVRERIFTLIALAETHWRMGDTGLAVEAATGAYDLVTGQSLAHRAKIANDLAWYLAQDGRYERARDMIAVTSPLEADHPLAPLWRADLLDTLGYICRQTGELAQAAAHFEEALALYAPGTFQVVDVLRNLGETYRDLGRPDDARVRLREALDLYEAQQRRLDARRTRLLLADLGP
jgi:tetratricopeptide (TPR) repeat protein